jgi:hypothetical protein
MEIFEDCSFHTGKPGKKETKKNSTKVRTRLNKRMQRIRDLFLVLIQNHKKMNYLQILKETCYPIQEIKGTHEEEYEYDTQEEIEFEEPEKDVDEVSVLLKMHSTQEQVFQFIKTCLSKLIPLEMRGSRHNFSALLKKVWRVISLNRYETIDEEFLVCHIRVKNVSKVFYFIHIL